MGVFKATPYRREEGENKKKSVFKATKYASYDPTAIKDWEASNKQSLGVLNDYSNRINKGEWLDEEDRKQYRSALDSYISTSNNLRGVNKTFGDGYSDEDEKKWTDSIASMNNRYDEITDIFSKFTNGTEYGHWFGQQQKINEWNSTLSAEDFEEYTQKGAGVSNPNWYDAHPVVDLFGWTPFGDGDDVNNMVTFAEANKNIGAAAGLVNGDKGSKYNEIVNLINMHMKDDEKAIYNYYIGKGEKEKAGEYLDYITDVLRQRQGGAIANQVDNTAMEAVISFSAGVSGGFTGLDNAARIAMGKEVHDTSSLQYAHGKASENNKGIWKGVNDLAYTTGNMTPSLIAGAAAGPAAGKVVGSIVTGLSSAGNSYAQMIEKGYGADQAMKYGVLTGAAEGGLSFLISGIGTVGGKLTGNIISKAIDGIDSGIARFFTKFAISSTSEAIEESAQSILEPIFKMIATGEEFEGIDWSEVAYSALLGALSAGLLEGVPNAVGGIHANYQTSVAHGGLSNMGAVNAFFKGTESGTKGFKGVSEAYKAGQQNVTEMAGHYASEALEIDPENAHAQRMQARLNKGKNVSGTQINRMVEANETALVSQDKVKIKSAVEAILTKYGETGDPSKIADIITKKIVGEKISRAEQNILDGSNYAEVVMEELDPNNEGARASSSGWMQNIGTERINTEAYNTGLNTESVDTPNTQERLGGGKIPLKYQLANLLKADGAVAENAGAEVSDAEGEIEAPADTINQIDTPDSPEADHIPESAKMVGDEDHVADVSETPAEAEESTVSLEEVSAKYGAQAQAFARTYTEGQDFKQYDQAYQMAYDMGKSGVSLSYAMQSKSTAYLTEAQRQLAYEAGQAAAGASASEQLARVKAAVNGKKGRKKGTVKGEGVTIADLKKTFNDTQNKAYKILCTFAEATGVDIVLYKSEANESGDFEGAQGKFNRKDDKLYIDINAGLTNIKNANDLAKYAMLRTFSHEFTHFLEKYNPEWYNELRKVVFDTLTSRGENVVDLIENKQAQNPSMDYDKASREVIAEAMTDILPDSHFIETLANKHKNIFEKLHEMLKEFLADIKEYFSSIGHNPSREANALKEQVGEAVHYVESIVKMFDEGAAAAVDNYQATVAIDEITDTETIYLTDETNEQAVSRGRNKETLSVDNGGQQNEYSESDQTEVQRLPEQKKRDVEMQPVSERDSKGDTEKQAELRKVQTEVRERYTEIKTALEKSDTADIYGVHFNVKPFGRKYAGLYKGVSTYTGLEYWYKGNTYETREEAIKDIVGRAIFEKMFGDIRIPNNNISDTKEVIPDAKEVTAGNDDHFSITENTEYGSLEIKFDGKPSEEIRALLKEHKFRWHKVKGVWYGKADSAELTKALQAAYKADEADARNKLLGETEQDIKNDEEVKPNVKENVDNERPILEPDADGQGASRLLDESQTEDVRGTSPERDSLGDTQQREHETSRDGDRIDADARDSRSEGSSESGDLRRDELTEQETQEKAEELAEVVEEQIEQKSTDKPKGNNFVIGDSLHLPVGEKARYRANVDAIRLIKKLETEGRFATAAEQEILSKYVGWGGLSGAFGALVWNRETRKSEMVPKDDWKNEFAELKSLIDDGIITEQEYKDMSASTRNAHYTSVEVIKAMYDGLGQLGFNGGRMLEPSSGVGNFVGAMPAEMSTKVNSWTMVELDRITGQIAKYLYPSADVRIQGFETANIPNNYMDVAIGNVPFGDYGVVDRAYPKRITKSIHNYFFAKSIDKVRPGGIVMFITSSFTMNSQDTTVRQFIMDRADLLGAIRLPNTAFKDNARTEVVTDILILKKRESGTEYAGEDFLHAEYDYEHGSHVSDYFKNHPEMVLGKAVTKRGMYGAHTLSYEPYTDRGTIDDQIREAFKNIKGKMDYPTKLSPEKTNFAVERATKKTKSGGFVVNSDGSISKSENGQIVKVDTDEKTAKRITGMLGIRDAYRKLANHLQQGLKESEIKKARKELNEAYDKFAAEYGYLNSPANKKAIDSDPDSYSILSLENYDANKKTAKKADIFTKDTISANKTVTHVNSVEEGVIASINLTGGVDVSLIAKLTDKSVEDVTHEVIEARLAFKTRDNGLIARETYLSGNVRAKLRDAEALAPYDKDFNHNIEELRKVIPTDIPYNEIYITPGATFIPNEIYADFIAHMLGGRNNPNSYSGPDVEVGRTASGEFKIVLNNKRLKSNYHNTQTWGTARKSFLELIDCMMGSRTVKVNDIVENGDGKKISVVNEAETEAANEKVKEIQKEFEDWIWKDENRREALARLYNETFNAIVNPKYDGSHLSVNGINAEYTLREHQANAVHRIIASGGNTLLAHRVGAGKTLEMAAAAMKMRELGVIKKPVFVVPKSVVAQWGVEFHSYFPAARLLVADDKSFTPANRKVFTNKIANGDYDAVIVTYEQFEKIPMSAEYQSRFYEEQIAEIINAIAEEKAESRDGKGLTVKEMEKKKAQLEKKLKELTSKPKDENNIDFEMLGIDSLFVDEAHNFKNLEYVSRMSNVAGLGSTKGVQRAFDLYTKVRYLQGLNGGRGIVFATATPVMNSMVELYIMQRYLQPDVLNQLGLKSFDAWAKQFGEVVNKWEINPSGTGMRQKQVFANFRNLNELQLLFRSFADVLTEVPGLKIPKMKGGAVKIVECEPGEFQKTYMQALQKRAENVKNVDPSEDNMLKITSDGRKVSYTQRMIDPTLPYEPECKIFKAAENILKEYQDSADIKGTQIVFLDMATPKGIDKNKAETGNEESTTDNYDEENARLYEDMRDYLVKKGIPKREIAFIHEADTDAKRKQLFENVNNGKVRVLIGSTGKMGVGMNAQKRVVAIHHLDAPWRPGDVEQRDGRAFRQKNMNEEVSKYVYVTKGSFDSRLWDILDRKQHFINQIMNGEDVGRTAEDTGEVTLSAAEVKALASGNPLIEEQTKLTDEIKKLENLQKAYNSSIRLAKTKLADDEAKIANSTSRIAGIREDIRARVDTYSDGKFSMTVGKQVFSDKKEAGAALAAEIVAKANIDSFVTVGKFAGFELRVIKNGSEYNGFIHGKESYKFNVYLNNTTRMVNHIGEVVAGFENIINNLEQYIDETTSDRNAQNKILAQPFEKQTELDRKRARFNEVMELLSPKSEQQIGKTDDDVQEQSREYLEDEQYQQRTDTLTDREILEIAANEIKVSDLSEAEQDALTIFRDRLSNLKDLQEKRAEQGSLYKEQQFGTKPDRAEAEKTLNRMHVLDGQIRKATADVLTVEEKAVLQRVLSKARKVVENNQRQHDHEMLERWRDRRDNAAAIKKYRERLRTDVDELSTWILKPDNKDIVKHVPDVLKNSVIPFLSSINFMSKRSLKGGAATKADQAFMETLKKLGAAMKKNIDVQGMYSGYNDLPPNFMDRLQTFIDSTEVIVKKNSGELVINRMTSEELKELSQIVRTLKKYITQLNRFHNNAMFQHVFGAGDDSVETLKVLKDASDKTGAVSNFLFWQQMRPAYAMERFGEGGKSIYDELRQGQAKLAFNTKEIEQFSKEAYTDKEVKVWENEIKEIQIGSDIVKMPVSYIMSFYELSKDPEALEHIRGEGIRVATYKKNGKKVSDSGHILTLGEFNQIIGSLTDRQKEVADKLQKYMAEQGGKWGNHVSVARFGEEMFTNKNYFPINSDGRHLSATMEEHPEAAALYALLNMSFTKSRKEGANNRIVIYSIFDVFANHMASMAQYNAMALPVLDAVKWFNYQQVYIDENGKKTPITTLRAQMDRVYGVPEETKPGSGNKGYATSFVENIIKAFNGTAAQGTPYDTFGLNPLRKYNMAQVAYNLRVAIQQPMAITRAGMLLDAKSILKGMKLKPAAIKKNIEEMQKYSGIAAWKSLGFYDVNISRGLTHLIKHDDTFLDKVGEVGMWGAEKLDIITWAAMWSACKEEVINKQNLTPSSEGFYEEVTKLFEDVVYKTQVVDSVLTKNEFMRDKGAFARFVGSFMSEATTNASMLLDAYDKYNLDIKGGMTKQQAWKKHGKHIGRTVCVYSVGAILLAAAQAVVDAWRDDDEYEEYGEKYLDAFIGNLVDELMPFNKLPILADFYDLAKELVSIFGVDTYGNPPQSVFMQWYDSLVKGAEIIHNKFAGETTNYTWYAGVYKLLQAASGMSGLALASATREVVSVWNNTVGAMAPSLKVITYEATAAETRDALYEAMVSGDAEEVARIEAKYDEEKDFKAALRKALRENDTRIREAAEASMKNDGATVNKLINKIISEGKFPSEIVWGAFAAELDKIKEDKKKQKEGK